MYTRTSLLLASLLAVALLPALAFGSAQADTEPEAAAAMADGEPQYGGTFTYLIWGTADAESADVHVDIWPALQYVSPVLEKLVNGNIDKYGPKGTGEYTFGPQPTVPYKYVDGNVVESWEVTPEKATLHVRPGVFWTGLSVNPGVMERREYTAQDLATNLQRILESPRGGGVVSSDFIATPYSESIYAQDDHTAIIEFKQFYFEWWTNILLSFEQMAPEVIAAGPKDWHNLVGTGPFAIKEYVSGSHIAYQRNPDYWKTTVIDGKEYQTPFVDEMVWPFIADESTQIAALRTATLDAHLNVDVAHPGIVGPHQSRSAEDRAAVRRRQLHRAARRHGTVHRCRRAARDDDRDRSRGDLRRGDRDRCRLLVADLSRQHRPCADGGTSGIDQVAVRS